MSVLPVNMNPGAAASMIKPAAIPMGAPMAGPAPTPMNRGVQNSGARMYDRMFNKRDSAMKRQQYLEDQARVRQQTLEDDVRDRDRDIEDQDRRRIEGLDDEERLYDRDEWKRDFEKEKNKHKESVKSLFTNVYKKDFTDETWDFIKGFSDQSTMIVYVIDDKVEGLTNLLYHNHNIGSNQLDFFIFTTSIVSDSFRQKGAYLSMFFEMRKILNDSTCEFILAYPNKTALPIITSSFYGFKNLRSFKMIEVENPHGIITPCDITNLLDIDERYSLWRFKNNEYYFNEVNDYILIYKHYNYTIDILEVFTIDDFKKLNIDIPLKEFSSDIKKYNIPSFRLKNSNLVDHVETQMICFLNKEKNNFNPIKLDFSCLCWDIL